jgi:hypothetical protein
LRIAKGAGLLAGVVTLIYVVYIIEIFLSMIVGLWHPTFPTLNSWVIAALDMIVYVYLGVQILRDRREFLVLAVFWTILGVALATFGLSYRNEVFNLLSFLIVFLCTYSHVTVTRADVTVSKSLGLLAGILALIQGILVALAALFAYMFRFGSWIIPILPQSQALIIPPVIVAAITAVVYFVSGVGMTRRYKEFFVLAIFWTVLESALAVVYSSLTRSHFNMISILILAFSSYYYFSKTRNP